MEDLILQQRANLYEGDTMEVKLSGSKAYVNMDDVVNTISENMEAYSDTITVFNENYSESNFTPMKFGKIKVVKLYVKCTGGTTSSWIELLTLPEGFRPRTNVYTNMTLMGINAIYHAKIRITTSGVLSVRIIDGPTSLVCSGDDFIVFM